MSKAKKIGGVVTKAVKYQNPYRIGGGYWASVEALRTLGVNKMHGFDVIVPAVQKAMGENFKAFKNKESENENAFSVEKRILTNVMVCSRKDYGAPLVAAGMMVKWDGRQKLAGLFHAGNASEVKATAKKLPASKTDAKKGKVIDRINAGGGIMVDVVEAPKKAKAKKATKAK